MNRKEIDDRMAFPILTLCLAVAAGKNGDIGAAKTALCDEVEHILDIERLRRRAGKIS
jgi:hypothetical protein